MWHFAVDAALSGMAVIRLHLDPPEMTAVIDELHAAERGSGRKTRLQALQTGRTWQPRRAPGQAFRWPAVPYPGL
jgi:hypothetical protein